MKKITIIIAVLLFAFSSADAQSSLKKNEQILKSTPLTSDLTWMCGIWDMKDNVNYVYLYNNGEYSIYNIYAFEGMVIEVGCFFVSEGVITLCPDMGLTAEDPLPEDKFMRLMTQSEMKKKEFQNRQIEENDSGFKEGNISCSNKL